MKTYNLEQILVDNFINNSNKLEKIVLVFLFIICHRLWLELMDFIETYNVLDQSSRYTVIGWFRKREILKYALITLRDAYHCHFFIISENHYRRYIYSRSIWGSKLFLVAVPFSINILPWRPIYILFIWPRAGEGLLLQQIINYKIGSI